jgi:metal-responsive CopG/Arc/MetJ family transcriptional regulator
MSSGHRLRNLHVEEVDRVIESMPESSRSRVKRIAVENFLFSVGANRNRAAAIMNLLVDAQQYRWNEQTIHAIVLGIDAALGPKESAQ